MSAVIVVFLVWFGLVLVLGAAAVALADRASLPEWCRRAGRRYGASVDAVLPPLGRGRTAATVLLAGWSVVIIVGWVLGLMAHRLEPAVDRPAFRWWLGHHLDGAWSDVWWKLTNVGSPTVAWMLSFAGAVVLAVLYRGRPRWWAPSLTLLLGYFAEKYSQMILKLVVHRGHPPTTLGTWPSGGMGRLITLYGLVIFFLILRFAPHSPRVWALGGTVLALSASVQAYARINNLEHWLTDVIGGTVYAITLLAVMIVFYVVLTRQPVGQRSNDPSQGQGSHRRADASLVV